jgi:hypothetical protein
VQYNRLVGTVGRLARARHSDGSAKFVYAGSFRFGDALERYAERLKVIDRP